MDSFPALVDPDHGIHSINHRRHRRRPQHHLHPLAAATIPFWAEIRLFQQSRHRRNRLEMEDLLGGPLEAVPNTLLKNQTTLDVKCFLLK